MHHLASSLFLSAVAVAQQVPSDQRVPVEPCTAPTAYVEVPIAEAAPHSGVAGDLGPVSSDDRARATSLTAMADAVLFDEPQPGQLWAGAPTWKAGFDGTAATFVPCFGSAAPRSFPARFAVTAVQLAGEPLPFTAGTPRQDGAVVSIARGAMVEQYVTSLAGIEQRFVFTQLPQRGELVVSIAVDTELQVVTPGPVHCFGNEFGSFEYGAAIAIDGRGRRTGVACSWADGALRLTVPAPFVASATLPLVIDPLIGNVVTVGSSLVHHGEVDLAYDASRDEYLVCFERRFSGSDSDVLGVRCNGAMQVIGSQFVIDNSSTSWRGCQVAGLDLYDKFFVVCECEQTGQPTFVAGRIFDAASGGISAPIDIEHGAVPCRHPDIGGDPFAVGPVYWTVVYERAVSAADHDIVIRQVQANGALRGTGYTPIDVSLLYEHSPVISESDGRDGSSNTQRWCVAYRRESSTLTSVRASTVTWNGVVDATQFVSPWYAITDNSELAVSSPTFESLGRQFLIAEVRVDSVTPNHEIWGAVVGVGGVNGGWQELLDYTTDRRMPAIACDGARFAVACSVPNGTLDLQVSLFDMVGNQLVKHEELLVSSAPTVDGLVAIVSHASGGAASPAGDRQFGMVWNAGGAVADTVGAARYRGMASTGGATVRATGCGSLQVGYPANVDFGAIGTTIQTSVQNPVGIVGWGIGDPVSVPLAGCGSCVVGTSAIVLVVGPDVQVPLPYNGALVGLTFAFQAFSLGTGSCLGAFEFSDTIDVKIR